MDALLYILAGAGVGFAVGLTGIGGGSLMTPLLLLFGFPAPTAIGTDLMYAAITKTGGVVVHHRQHTIDWSIVARLAAGSIPASLMTIWLLSNWFNNSDAYARILTSSLGFMLIMTALVLLSRRKFVKSDQTQGMVSWLQGHAQVVTFIMGFLLGVLVTLSSVGAGAFGTAVLLVLYPALASVRVVGTDLAHAVPLTLVAGFGHLLLGNVDFLLLGSLLIGSLPAIHLGAKLGQRLPEILLQRLLALILLGMGIRYAFI
ncbi:sulfite exporter TauE/SafE family protein [Sansalvadorimonas sp. 2012CJ34-2]|uniref:Probable membrane transporter protein n=1 Tax=Parendozoicomonas callyspongiae TaxID=2942213 RepID=A0ABT0PKN6_9GAMM|nr:sulfite exporter TauE/SafE family protein [Sansalvadorimonas sp. 2012CJ34-2]MCL6271939.1 sulfite exporter TauE/SafE family protein [Sansalvadorimonas sp. 2012CJ34-2]